MKKVFLLPNCDVDINVISKEIDCGNIESTWDVTQNANKIRANYTQQDRDAFLQKIGINPKVFFEDE